LPPGIATQHGRRAAEQRDERAVSKRSADPAAD